MQKEKKNVLSFKTYNNKMLVVRRRCLMEVEGSLVLPPTFDKLCFCLDTHVLSYCLPDQSVTTSISTLGR